jgi:hypothetical protein
MTTALNHRSSLISFLLLPLVAGDARLRIPFVPVSQRLPSVLID